MSGKYGNYLNGMLYGKIVSINGISRRTQKGICQHFTGYLDIDAWMIRNLMSHKNCSLKESFFYKYKKQFEFLFGKDNVKATPTSDGFCVVEINNEAVEQALPLVLEED